jgi:hypothetical protein
MTVGSLDTPIRRLEGIAYWVINDPDAIHDFINTEIRKEWEQDARSEHRDPRMDPWLKNLSKRKWSLRIVQIGQVSLNPEIMNFVDKREGYVFAESLAQRRQELQQVIRRFGVVLWPLVVKEENMQLVDGYCRYVTLKAMGISRIYVYVGTP